MDTCIKFHQFASREIRDQMKTWNELNKYLQPELFAIREKKLDFPCDSWLLREKSDNKHKCNTLRFFVFLEFEA